MGQKTNPNILRLNINKNYFYRYLEKKSSELPLYDFNILEIKQFTYKFFEINKLHVNSCKINYSQNNILRFFITYCAVPCYATKSYKKKEKKKKNLINPELTTFYSNFKSSKKLRTRRIQVKKGNFFKRKLKNFYFRYGRFHANFLLKRTFLKTKSSYFLNYFCDSLSKFLNKKNIKISLILTQLNSNETKKINKRTVEFLKRSISSLFFFKRFPYYRNGINILFLCAQRPDSISLLNNYIASVLPKQKHHLSFLKFVMQALVALKKNNKFSKIETIKIKVKGRINRRPRARHTFFELGHKRLLPVLSLNSKIHFSEKTSFTPNGTLGLKIWSLGKFKKTFTKLKKVENKNLVTNNQKIIFPLIARKFLPIINKNFNKINFSTVVNSKIDFGDFAIVANQKGYINKTQFEATKLAIKRILKREGKIWQKAFPTLLVTGKSKGSRMGKGKGKVKYSVCFVKKVGTVLFEITGVKKSVALKALKIGMSKLPIKTSIV